MLESFDMTIGVVIGWTLAWVAFVYLPRRREKKGSTE